MPDLSRRSFLAGSAALAAAAYSRAADKPNDKVRLAVMGVHGRGRDLARSFVKCDGVEVVTLIDPDENLFPKAVKELPAAPKLEKDVRRALEDPSVTALVVAAPDHWHALATIWACQAGKHVYVEKPISHNLIEGRRMVQAARKHGRVVQVGTQRRSAPHFMSARDYVRSGKLGKVPFAKAWIGGNRPSIGKKPDGPVPAGVDYDLWLGPAPQRPVNPNRFHYEWHWNWDYGTGELGNNGIHGLDCVRMLLDLDAPSQITSAGGKLFYDDDRQTPDTQVAAFDFPGTTVTWEHRIWAPKPTNGESFGVELFGQKGTLIVDSKGWRVEDGEAASDKATDPQQAHVQNFVDCVRGSARPNADIEEGHKTTRMCHLGNIAHRVGRVVTFDAATETLVNDAAANALLGRSYRKGFELPAV